MSSPPRKTTTQKPGGSNQPSIFRCHHQRSAQTCQKSQTRQAHYHMDDSIKSRNKLRKTISTNRKEYLAACAAVNSAKKEVKEEQWVVVVNSAIDERSMRRFIKSLNGSPSINSQNESMKINVRVITSTKEKAEAH